MELINHFQILSDNGLPIVNAKVEVRKAVFNGTITDSFLPAIFELPHGWWGLRGIDISEPSWIIILVKDCHQPVTGIRRTIVLPFNHSQITTSAIPFTFAMEDNQGRPATDLNVVSQKLIKVNGEVAGPAPAVQLKPLGDGHFMGFWVGYAGLLVLTLAGPNIEPGTTVALPVYRGNRA